MNNIKYTYLLIAGLFGLLFAVSLIHENYIEKEAFNEIAKQHQINLHEIKIDISNRLNESVNAIHFLYSTPPISGLVRAATDPEGIDRFDGTPFDGWRSRLETIFTAFLENNAQYSQARLIYADSGDEFIRVERFRGDVRVATPNLYQNKKHTDYFIEATQLKRQQLYVSPISLNREFGEITVPYQPTIRFILPIFTEHGQLFAFLIINKNLTSLFESAREFIPAGQQLAYSDEAGYFLEHFDPALYFTKDLSPDKTFTSEYTTTTLIPNLLSKVTPLSDTMPASYVSSSAMMVPSGHRPYQLTVSIFSDSAFIDKFLWDRRVSFYTAIAIVLLLFSMALSLINRASNRNRKLAEARAEAQAVVTAAIDVIITLDNQGAVTSCNFAAERMLGVNKQQLLGEKLAPYFNPHSNTPIETIISNTETESDLTWNKGAEECHYHCTKSVIKLSKKVSALALIFRDSTQDMQAKQEAANINQVLETKIAKRTQELESARNEAVENSKVKSQFISNISHEMRTPLNGILGALAMLKRQRLLPETEKFINMAEVSAFNLNVLINDILDLSKIEAGKLDLESKLFNPTVLINDQVTTHAVKAIEKGLEFYLDTSALNFRTFRSDPHRLAQVLNNIISNAIKFTERGAVIVKARTDALDSTGTLTITISDTGIGIAKEKIPKLFNAFQQADNNIASRYGGTGLGLLICKQLVNMMGGDITLDSELHKGTDVTITLPTNEWEPYAESEIKRLTDKTVGVYTHSENAARIITNIVKSLDGKPFILENSHLEAPLPDLPDNLIVDVSLSEATKLVTWLSSQPNKPKLFVLKAFTQNFHLDYEPLEYLNKPLLRTEFLAKFINQRGQTSEFVSDFYHRRQTDVDAQHLYDASTLKGKVLLIVDDNDINLEVAASLLSELPVTIYYANSGEDAITRLINLESEGTPADAILMDCNMPGIDGYEATQLIRQGKAGEHTAAIPIIAMTANALQGEREKCLRIGMDDFITKPLEPNEFITKSVAWLQTEEVVISTPEEAQTSPKKEEATAASGNTQQEPEPSLPIWDKGAALGRLMNNEALLNKLVDIFLSGAEPIFAELSAAVHNGDYETVRQRSHKLKGQTGEIGAQQLYDTMSKLEQSAKNQEPDINTRFNVAKTQFEALLDELKQATEA
ncbi:ATP-binding protein [Marisediminitalea sp.]|uniref:ATP-binding protein n=1 Tax=Marisediminitalea sp. TaxID=2662268 RepID=UPI0035184792